MGSCTTGCCRLGCRFPPADAVAAADRGVAEGAYTQPSALTNANKAEDQISAVEYVARALVRRKQAGEFSLIYTGGASTTGPESLGLHLAACFLNAVLGNEGVTVSTAAAPTTRMQPSIAQARAVLDAAINGQVSSLVIWGVNPAYDLPGGADLLAAVRARGVPSSRWD